ncbi:uncharacterized protein FIBRA_00169 [Fibroporia radiculosa]|uniref:Autophagy-related protein 17 n=1 Tax=Fibroporia radiculosa TaxID=599839 RepID=J7RV35_9APHY|nr:uncharacterized protein FIBRA_00169 [Fibroporia radiculosa]CCL98175.1 predicted protein [Fibroporia radiculosa]
MSFHSMATSPPVCSSPGQPHLVSLVLQSKKALQHGEALCARASALSSASSQTAVDVLALDAKVRWITDAVLEQLKVCVPLGLEYVFGKLRLSFREMAAQVAKSIEQKRTQFEAQVAEWDAIRSQRTDALDTILESLGAQVVPPSFHASLTSDISPFGNQRDSDEEDSAGLFGEQRPDQSPTHTLRSVARPRVNGTHSARSSWKTLRDFVNERDIEKALDRIESDRDALDAILAKTSDYPESLSGTISNIEITLPDGAPLPSVNDVFVAQEVASHKMANLLESLAGHYDQMFTALHEREAGEEFSEEDIQQMHRDTNELPAVVTELEESIVIVETSHQQLLSARQTAQQQLGQLRCTLDELDELGDIMAEMLERQQIVEQNESIEHLTLLHQHLIPIEELHHQFASYQYSYSKLLLELDRRRQYRETAENIVRGMVAQLNAMTEEERVLREDFNTEFGRYIPEDVCIFAQNIPTRWSVVPWNDQQVETLLVVDSDLLEEVSASLILRDNGSNKQQLKGEIAPWR